VYQPEFYDGYGLCFAHEAAAARRLSGHRGIVSVHGVGTLPDGRPYLVMELCSSSLSSRYRKEVVPVSEVLRIAVKIGSAVETAHRAGVLHRDIKPSNILMTAYGHPVLSDFGIASTLAESNTQEAVGMSIPWSAPEVLMDETAGSIASEIWALGATVYSLLAGRSPFEVTGGSNGSSDLISRINRAKPQPIGRDDVPKSLEQALLTAMARKPGDRQASALEFVRQLQSVELEIGAPQTQVEVAMDDWALATVADLEERTRVRGPSGLAPVAPAAGRRRRRSAELVAKPPTGSFARDSRSSRKKNTSTAATPPPARGMQVLAWTLVACAVLVIALGATATLILLREGSGNIPVVSDIDASISGTSVEFSWKDPGLASGDLYQISTDDDSTSSQSQSVFVVNAEPGDRVCMTVTINRDGKLGSPSAEKCVDLDG